MDSALVPRIGERLLKRKQWLATAESCTGGMIAQWLTNIAGTSEWFERGLVTYSNQAKMDLLGVPPALIERHGAVSQQCAEAMALGVLQRAPVQWSVSVTGIAGPGGGTREKPVGTVWIGVASEGKAEVMHFLFFGDRDAIRRQSTQAALTLLDRRLRA